MEMEEPKIIYETKVSYSLVLKHILGYSLFFIVAFFLISLFKEGLNQFTFWIVGGSIVSVLSALYFLNDFLSAAKIILTSDGMVEIIYLNIDKKRLKINAHDIVSIEKQSNSRGPSSLILSYKDEEQTRRKVFSNCIERYDLMNLIYEINEMGGKVELNSS